MRSGPRARSASCPDLNYFQPSSEVGPRANHSRSFLPTKNPRTFQRFARGLFGHIPTKKLDQVFTQGLGRQGSEVTASISARQRAWAARSLGQSGGTSGFSMQGQSHGLQRSSSWSVLCCAHHSLQAAQRWSSSASSAQVQAARSTRIRLKAASAARAVGICRCTPGAPRVEMRTLQLLVFSYNRRTEAAATCVFTELE